MASLKQCNNTVTGKEYDHVPYATREDALEAAQFAAAMVKIAGGGMPEGWSIELHDGENVEVLTESDLLGGFMSGDIDNLV